MTSQCFVWVVNLMGIHRVEKRYPVSHQIAFLIDDFEVKHVVGTHRLAPVLVKLLYEQSRRHLILFGTRVIGIHWPFDRSDTGSTGG